MTDLNRRNTQSVMQRLTEMEAKLVEQQARIDGLLKVIMGLSSRLEVSESHIMQERIRTIGHKATVV